LDRRRLRERRPVRRPGQPESALRLRARPARRRRKAKRRWPTGDRFLSSAVPPDTRARRRRRPRKARPRWRRSQEHEHAETGFGERRATIDGCGGGAPVFSAGDLRRDRRTAVRPPIGRSMRRTRARVGRCGSDSGRQAAADRRCRGAGRADGTRDTAMAWRSLPDMAERSQAHQQPGRSAASVLLREVP